MVTMTFPPLLSLLLSPPTCCTPHVWKEIGKGMHAYEWQRDANSIPKVSI